MLMEMSKIYRPIHVQSWLQKSQCCRADHLIKQYIRVNVTIH
jgi:hypothetical protein